MSGYQVEIISPQDKDDIINTIMAGIRYERKANIHGACVKLITDNSNFKEEWEDNFKFMNEDIRPHAKVFAVGNGGDLRVLYEPVSKTCIIKNCDYYGWIKSIALAVISDFFEEYHSIHRRYSVHGSAVDYNGHAIAIIGPPGTGKTTLTYGLLQNNDFNYISDDWFFTRLFRNANVIYSSEKNSYIREDIANVWESFSKELNKVKLDRQGRGIADVNTLFEGRSRESSTLKTVVLLERDKNHHPFIKLDIDEALNFIVDKDFCNPHQLIRNDRKFKMRKNFFKEVFSKQDVYLLNTIETPNASLNRIKDLATR
ncbi:MAG: AAA family ATPase [Methanobacterium sp.]|nr:AAA family ATPase [Methanobacterium sp.]